MIIKILNIYEIFKKEKENENKGILTNPKLLKDYLKSKSNNKTIYSKIRRKYKLGF